MNNYLHNLCLNISVRIHLYQLKQNKYKMKKVMFLAATSAVMVLASCGGGADKEAARKKQEADSLAKVEQARQDSINAAMQVQTVDVYTTAKNNPDFTTLVALLDQAGLASTLQDASVNYTVFAPTNAAFDKLDAKVLADLKDPKNAEKLKDLLLFHVVRGKLLAADIAVSGELQALNDKVIAVKQGEAGTVSVAGAAVTTADLDATNGVVHVVDAVLVVPAKKGTAKPKKPVVTKTPETPKAPEGQATGRGGDQTENKTSTGRGGDQTENKTSTGRGGK
jgi:uncharacterized surface protein with fasciclin (FAS1) repeats